MLRHNNNSHEGVSSLTVLASATDMITSKPWQTILPTSQKMILCQRKEIVSGDELFFLLLYN
jgi:hypothetical protein